MANKNILTYGTRANIIKQMFYSPVITIPNGAGYKTLTSTYAFLAHIDAWGDDLNPPAPQQTQAYIKNVFKNIFAVKQLTVNDMCPVIQRIDWTSGNSYDAYTDFEDILDLDDNGNLKKDFYVKNRYNQVFKCLWNNDGSPSTYEPYFEPGVYDTTNGIYQQADGYKWKYLYTIDIGSKFKFMDETWMPVILKSNTANPTSYTAGCGNIDVINVSDHGTGYSANSPVTVTIIGDGTGATATATVSSGGVSDITVTNTGSNYSYATVVLSSAYGANASAFAPVSPVGGHGSDPLTELGCSHIMFTTEFNGTEGGYIPTDVDYHQIGLLFNPISLQSNPEIANGAIYKTSTDLVLAASVGSYINDEVVYQGTSLATATFTATVLSYDSTTNLLKLVNTVGTPVINNSLYASLSGTVKTVLSYTTPNLVPFSGYIGYIENRAAIQRSPDGIEQLKTVLGL
jgi:hypothetical protein